jgi:hypothetical protein
MGKEKAASSNVSKASAVNKLSGVAGGGRCSTGSNLDSNVSPSKGAPNMLKKVFAAVPASASPSKKPPLTYQCVKLMGDAGAETLVAVFYWNGNRTTTERINSVLTAATAQNRFEPRMCLIFITNEMHPEFGNRLEQLFRRSPRGIPEFYPTHVVGQAVNIINAVPRMLPYASSERISALRQNAFDERAVTLATALPDIIEAFGSNSVRLPDVWLNDDTDLLAMSLVTWARLVKASDDFEAFLMTPAGIEEFPWSSALLQEGEETNTSSMA